MQRIEQILDSVIKRIRAGEKISSIVFSYPAAWHEQIYQYIEISRLTDTLPIKHVPSPNKRRKYLDHEKQNIRFAGLFRVIKAATFPVAFVMIVGLFTGTVYGAAFSLPGEKLFVVKKGIALVQLKLANKNPEKKAKVQLAIANQRLEEARTVIQNKPSSDAKKQAIKELQEQTKVALNNVKQIAGTPAVTKDPEIMKKVESLTESQNNLVAKVDPNDTSKNDTLKTVKDIKRIVALANEQDGIKLPVAAVLETTGSIGMLKKTSIKVDQNTFDLILSKLIIEDKDGGRLTFDALSLNDQIKITGRIQDDKNIAEKIIVLEKAKVEAKKKPTSTTIVGTIPASSGQQGLPPSPAFDSQITPQQQLPPDANKQDTTAGFIAEPGNF